VLKAGLRAVPWFGWACQSFLFIFLGRGRENRAGDVARIATIVRYVVEALDSPNTLVLFPEGTDLSESNLEKDRK
jgi:1-acyl-sn-glycerol-3-phosphate acyltransferase